MWRPWSFSLTLWAVSTHTCPREEHSANPKGKRAKSENSSGGGPRPPPGPKSTAQTRNKREKCSGQNPPGEGSSARTPPEVRCEIRGGVLGPHPPKSTAQNLGGPRPRSTVQNSGVGSSARTPAEHSAKSGSGPRPGSSMPYVVYTGHTHCDGLMTHAGFSARPGTRDIRVRRINDACRATD